MTGLQRNPATADGRVAVVTGGASGIGQATAARLAADGFRVAVLDLSDGAEGNADLAVRADVTDPADVQRAFTEILSALGRIDVLVNNAGITGSAEATVCHETPVEEWSGCRRSTCAAPSCARGRHCRRCCAKGPGT